MKQISSLHVARATVSRLVDFCFTQAVKKASFVLLFLKSNLCLEQTDLCSKFKFRRALKKIYLTILKYFFLSCPLVIDHFYLEDAAEWIRSGAPWGVEVGASVISRNL
jgi:hypothetical protein